MALGTPVQIGSHTQATGIGATLAMATSADCAAGDLVFGVLHGGSSNAATGVADDAFNSYTLGTTLSSGTRRITPFWSRLTNPLASGANVTATFSSATGVKLGVVTKITGTAASPLDQEGAGATGTATTNPSITTGTLAQAAEAVMAWVVVNGGDGDGFTPDGDFTELTGVSSATASGAVIHLAYQITAATTALTYNPTLGTARDWATNYAAFKEAAAASAARNMMLMGAG